MFSREWDDLERCGELMVEGGGLVGMNTLGGRVLLQVALEGPGEGVNGDVVITIGIPVKAGRKWRGGS